ncbi:LysR family transcriptional regulator [Pararhodobacter oceanensis]|uniref:Transcriptional regulator n=1 Tax=Pararhodobacter oceanensis TaxID=2172121 RepID=A0A2T8HY85_9RHOB|nr:LysR family transcriptional regulator [Pararhodobacter oceanensis]PVH30361.1 transcriptional regulator [Pararhodobacter oceanensis]
MDRLDCDRMFIAVIESGSFVGASQLLKTSSGQASKLVARLEADLGVQLLNRTTRSVAPTEAGRAYYERLRPLIDEWDTLDLDIRNISQSPRGRLRITAPQSFGNLELAQALIEFAASYPDIALDVSFSDRLAHVVDEGFDMAVRVGRPGDSSLVMRRLCSVRLVLVAAPQYLGENGTPASPKDLAHHACIIDSNLADPDRWQFTAPSGQDAGTRVSGRLRFSNAEACLIAAEAGHGLAYVPAFVAGASLRAGRVMQVLQAYEPAPYDVFVLYPHARHLSAKVRLLVDALVARYKGQPAWEAGWQ